MEVGEGGIGNLKTTQNLPVTQAKRLSQQIKGPVSNAAVS